MAHDAASNAPAGALPQQPRTYGSPPAPRRFHSFAEMPFDPWPSLAMAAVAGAVNGLYVAAGWTQLRDRKAMAVSAVAGALLAAASEAARLSAGGIPDVSSTLGVSGVVSVGGVALGLAATTPEAEPDPVPGNWKAAK